MLVALTGGIGSGKSTVADAFAHRGAFVIDSDQLARAVIERGTPGFDEVVSRFGDSILSDGDIDRARLSEIVFRDEVARKDLEGIIHPLIRNATAELISYAGSKSIIINQIPLLFETDGAKRFDAVITVEADLDIRRQRLRERGMKDYEIDRRIAAQATDQQRSSISDFVIVNNGSIDDVERRVEEVWQELVSRVSNS